MWDLAELPPDAGFVFHLLAGSNGSLPGEELHYPREGVGHPQKRLKHVKTLDHHKKITIYKTQKTLRF